MTGTISLSDDEALAQKVARCFFSGEHYYIHVSVGAARATACLNCGQLRWPWHWGLCEWDSSDSAKSWAISEDRQAMLKAHVIKFGACWYVPV